MADLVVWGANLKNSRRSVRYLRRRSRRDAPDHFDICGVYEAHKRRRLLRQLPGHDYRTGDHPGPSQETGILVGRHFTDLGHGATFLSPAAPQFESVGKERWGQVGLFEVGGQRVAAIVLHPVAGPDKLADLDRDALDRRYQAAMTWLDATIAYLRDLGYEVIVIADIQMREAQTAQPWAPRHVFEEHGMEWLWEDIDVIAWTSGLTLVGHPITRVRHGVLPDHPLLRVELNINRTRRT